MFYIRTIANVYLFCVWSYQIIILHKIIYKTNADIITYIRKKNLSCFFLSLLLLLIIIYIISSFFSLVNFFRFFILLLFLPHSDIWFFICTFYFIIIIYVTFYPQFRKKKFASLCSFFPPLSLLFLVFSYFLLRYEIIFLFCSIFFFIRVL